MPFPVSKPQVAPFRYSLTVSPGRALNERYIFLFRKVTKKMSPWPPSPSLGVATVANGKLYHLPAYNIFKIPNHFYLCHCEHSKAKLGKYPKRTTYCETFRSWQYNLLSIAVVVVKKSGNPILLVIAVNVK